MGHLPNGGPLYSRYMYISTVCFGGYVAVVLSHKQ